MKKFDLDCLELKYAKQCEELGVEPDWLWFYDQFEIPF